MLLSARPSLKLLVCPQNSSTCQLSTFTPGMVFTIPSAIISIPSLRTPSRDGRTPRPRYSMKSQCSTIFMACCTALPTGTPTEYLKTDFRVSLGRAVRRIWRVVWGAALRRLHLMGRRRLAYCRFRAMETMWWPPSEKYLPRWQVWINKTQYFADIPQEAWKLYVGGYQPAQKWLKDRKGRA